MKIIAPHYSLAVSSLRAVLRHTLLFGALAVMLGLLAQPAQADTGVVTNTNDSGIGSLRQAVLDAAPSDTIVFDSAVFSVPLTITLTSGQIEISKSLTINGAPGGIVTPTISGNHISSVFRISADVSVSLIGLRIADGYCQYCGGGGIFNDSGTISVVDCILIGNSAGMGGGIFNGASGKLSVTSSILSNNKATLAQGYGWGGGIYNEGLLSIFNSTVVNNSANSGGGIFNYIGTSAVVSSTFVGNSAVGGGGIINSSNGGLIVNSTVSITNSTFISNSASEGGGISNDCVLSTTNSTFMSNHADIGGGILNRIHGTAKLLNSTLTANTASSGGGLYKAGVTTLRNTLIANNGAGDNCLIADSVSLDGGHNFDSGNTCGFSATGSLTNTNPLLGPLGNYGGPVPTLPLLPGSLALDNGDDAACPDTDARGVPRPIGPHCDIGAFEGTGPFRSMFLPIIRR